MATTVHIPAEVLKSVDLEARRRRVSRNKYIVEALKNRLAADRSEQRIPQELFDDMKRWRQDPERVRLVEEMRQIIMSSRRSKKPVPL